jgi:dolichol-phosphate mannosyltransferase
MLDETTTTAVAPPLPLHRRVRHGLRHPANWLQFLRFGVVGASGYLVNLAVFAFAVHVAGIQYLVAVANNFWWNRHWTFAAHDGHAGFQAARFFAVSVAAFLFSAGVLALLVEDAGMAKVAAQAIAIVAATPLSFLGQKLWSFGR